MGSGLNPETTTLFYLHFHIFDTENNLVVNQERL